MPMKPQVYKDDRPAEYFTRFHERARRRGGDWVYDLCRLLLTPYVLLLFRARCIDSDNVPLEGPAIIAPNHFSFLDHFFVAVYLRRKVQFMAKSQLFKRPMQFIYTHGGVFPVRRGARDEETFVTAEMILAKGGAVAMYCEGGRAGLENLARTLSIEWARHAVTTVAIAPGASTSAGELAALVAYLASPAG